jgi:hypothetical protein
MAAIAITNETHKKLKTLKLYSCVCLSEHIYNQRQNNI